MEYLEPLIEERFAKAKERATKVFNGDLSSSNDDSLLMDCLQYRLAQYLKIGFFDSYFHKLTLDDMLFELELYKLAQTTNIDRSGEMLSKATPEEIDQMFPDSDFQDVPMAPDENFMQDAKKFMESGEFK
jgi:hypothetical protein